VHGRDGGFLRGKEENVIADVLPATPACCFRRTADREQQRGG
jgi:hypothetical protein